MIEFFEAEHYYNNSFHYHCLKNCFYQLLRYYEVANAYLYIDIAAHFSLTISDNLSQCIIFNDTASLETIDILRPYVIRKQFNDLDKAEDDLSESLKRGGPIIVSVDTFYLPYQLSYHKYHGSHAIFICGEIEKNYQIVDWYEPHFYKGFIERSDLRLARSSRNESDDNPFSHIGPYYLSWMFCNEIGSALHQMSEKCIFQQTMRNTYQNFYKQAHSFFHRDKFIGILGVEKLIAMLEAQIDMISTDTKLFRKLHNTFFLLYIEKRILKFYILQYTINNNINYRITNIIETLLERYRSVLFLLMKNSKVPKKETTNKIINILQEVLFLENEIGIQIKYLME